MKRLIAFALLCAILASCYQSAHAESDAAFLVSKQKLGMRGPVPVWSCTYRHFQQLFTVEMDFFCPFTITYS